jgi:hypothetical protein
MPFLSNISQSSNTCRWNSCLSMNQRHNLPKNLADLQASVQNLTGLLEARIQERDSLRNTLARERLLHEALKRSKGLAAAQVVVNVPNFSSESVGNSGVPTLGSLVVQSNNFREAVNITEVALPSSKAARKRTPPGKSRCAFL